MKRENHLWPFVVALALGGVVALFLINDSADDRNDQKREPNAKLPPELWYGIYDSFRYGEQRPYLAGAAERLAAIRTAGLRVLSPDGGNHQGTRSPDRCAPGLRSVPCRAHRRGAGADALVLSCLPWQLDRPSYREGVHRLPPPGLAGGVPRQADQHG